MKKVSLVIIFIFICCFSIMHSQSAKKQLKLINSVTLNDKEFFEEISFQNKFGYFIIPVNIGNESYEYIFDTGGYNTLTSDIMEKNALPNLMDVQVGSSNKLKSKIALTQIPSAKIGGINFKDIGALNFDFDDSPQIKCYTNGGLIGKSIIKTAVWQLNAKEEKIMLTDDIEKLSHLENAIKLKVKFNKVFDPFIEAKINGKKVSFMLDFGFGGFVSLTEKDGINLSSQGMVEIEGEGSVSANGVVNESIFIKSLDNFEIGNMSIPNEVAHYAKSNNYNLIGTEIAKHFIVTLNFKDKELFLTPIDKMEEPKLSFGFNLNRNDKNMYVSRVYKDGSADKKGLKLNDVIISINDEKFNEASYCDFYDYINELLKGNENIKLGIERNNELQTINIAKRDLFN